ncbi:MAG: right-handed parallel beta-helix repeat-containing protein, partial [Thermoplasmata archaeon]
FTTIQDAVDNASIGETIQIWAGVYYENVIINKTVTLIGNKTSTTTINGTNSGDVLLITANWVNISGLTITGSGSGFSDSGVELYHTHNCSITNNNVINNANGIRMIRSGNNSIYTNNILKNVYGITGTRVYNNNIYCNEINNNLEGITFFDSSMPPTDIPPPGNDDLFENNIYNNTIGITLYVEDAGSIDEVNILSSVISKNDIGIKLLNRGGGIGKSIISNCTLEENRIGIFMDQIDESDIKSNRLINNKQFAIQIENSSLNLIHHNNFTSNNNGLTQAFDNSNWNYWNDTAEGNYWSDYVFRYSNAINNGKTWNKSYELDGQSGAKDYFPLVNAAQTPENIAPSAEIIDISPNPVYGDQKISFEGQGTDPDGYIIAYLWKSDLDGFLSSQSKFTTDPLSIGHHTITFSVQDNSGLWSEEVSRSLIIYDVIPYDYDLYRPPIEINSNAEFTAENGVTGGSGTKDDPYIIGAWNISGKYFGPCITCIKISNTDAHFIISNCNLNDSGMCSLGSAGIHMINVTNGTIERSTFVDNMNALWVWDCSNIVINKNEILNTEEYGGLMMVNSNNVTFIQNICSNTDVSINFYDSKDNIIEHNIFEDNRILFSMYQSERNVIRYNHFLGCSEFAITYSENNTFHHNNFVDINETNIFDPLHVIKNNQWDNGDGFGNYWSEYDGLDNGESGRTAGDRVGDTDIPYLGLDDHPLMNPVSEIPEVANIEITLELAKTKFQKGEAITGEIIIINSNSFDIVLNETDDLTEDIEGDRIWNEHFIIFSLDNNEKYPGVNNNYLYPIFVKAQSWIKIDFEVVSNSVNLSAGKYSISSFFYYYNNSNYFKAIANHFLDFLQIESTPAYFQIIEKEIPGIENITIILELTKSEFYFGEQITGSIKVANSNSYDVALSDKPLQRLLGDHFDLDSLDNSNSYVALSESDLYTIEVKAFDTTEVEFKIKTFMLTTHLIETVLPVGNYSIQARLYFGNMTDFDFVYSNIEYFTVVENKSLPQDDSGPGTGSPLEKTAADRYVMGYIAVITIVIIVLITGFISATEVGKYGFFSSIAPLYSKNRRRKRDQEDGYNKGLIMGYIDGNPGESYSSIKSALKLNNGTLAYYLRILIREEIIRAERDGTLKRFYPAKGRITRDVLELSDIQNKIFDAVKESPGISQKAIQEQLDISQQRLNYQIKLMADARLIRLEREGKLTKCYVVKDEEN